MERLRGRDFSGDSTTENIIQFILKVYSVLGPGFLERIYRNALSLELRANGMSAEMETDVKILYQGQLVGRNRADVTKYGRVVPLTPRVPQIPLFTHVRNQ